MTRTAYKSVLFLAIFCWSWLLSAQVRERLQEPITWQFKNVSFREALELFENEVDAYFQYDASLKPKKSTFSANYRRVKAKDALSDFLKRYGLTYALVMDNSIVLKPWKPIEDHLRVAGRINHALSGERVVGATIYSETEGVVTHSNAQGVFYLRTKQKQIDFVVSYPGFQSFRDTIIGSGKSFFVEVNLRPQIDRFEVTEIKVKRKNDLPQTENGWSDRVRINGKQLDHFTHLFGEPDVLRALSNTPGVVSGSEGVFGMYVRGGAADQNLILLDDVPVYNPYHMYGLFGIFNGDIVKNAEFYRGNFPTQHGGRLSSVIKVDTKEGNPDKLHGNVNLGLLSSRLFISGPLFSKKTSFLFGARRSFFDYLVEPVLSGFQGNPTDLVNRYNFWDLNAKITHRFSEKSRLTLMGYSGQDYAGLINQNSSVELDDVINERSEDATYWGNDIASLKWDWLPGPSTHITLKTYFTGYTFRHQRDYQYDFRKSNRLVDEERSLYRVSNGIYDVEGSLNWSEQWTSRFKTVAGVGYTYHSFIPNQRTLTSIVDSVRNVFLFNDEPNNTPEYFTHAQAFIQSGKWGYYDVGLRMVYYDLGLGQFYLLPEPRWNARWKLHSNLWFKLSGSQNRQFFHQLNNLTMGLPSDLWVPSTAKFKPAQSRQLSAALSLNLPKRWLLTTEVFQRSFRDLLEYSESSVYITSNRNWESSVTSGVGETKGVEIQLSKSSKNVSGMISYTWMNNTRQFVEINDNISFPSRYDRRHNIYATLFWKINSMWNITGSWMYNSGFAYTLPVGVIPSPSSNDIYQDIYIYGQRNNQRAIDNHRLDLSLSRRSFVQRVVDGQNKRLAEITWSFGVYNVYNRLNPFYINIGVSENKRRSVYQVSLLPIMPFINYQIKF